MITIDLFRPTTNMVDPNKNPENSKGMKMALTRKITGAKPDDPRPEYIFDDAVKTSAVDPDLGLPMDKIKWMRDRLVQDGQLAASFDITKMIEPGIRTKALELAGSGH